MTDDNTHLSETESRAGRTTGVMRPILFFSLLLIVAILIVLYMFWSE